MAGGVVAGLRELFRSRRLRGFGEGFRGETREAELEAICDVLAAEERAVGLDNIKRVTQDRLRPGR